MSSTDAPNYKMVIIASAIVIVLSALILILLGGLWVTADWSVNELLLTAVLITVIGGMALPATVLLLSFLGLKKYSNDKPKTKFFGLINTTIIGIALLIAVTWLFFTIELIAEAYLGFYIGIIICIAGSIGLLTFCLISEIKYLIHA
jgi:hypothetical protein